MVLIPIWGFYGIQTYGLCIALGIILFMISINHDEDFKKSRLKNHFDLLLCTSIVCGIFGGRILYYLTHHNEINTMISFFSIWNGGLSILGAVIAIVITIISYLIMCHIPVFQTLDLISLYAPLLHAAGRIGCFFAGCCHGSIWHGAFSIIYTDPDSLGLKNIPIHPSQLYSVITFASLFLLFYFLKKRLKKHPGTIFFWYIIAIGSERFCNEFFRYEYQIGYDLISTNQIIAIAIACGTICIYYYKNRYK